MDASEHETDARLYKASAELLSELLLKLPSLVEKPGAPEDIRRWVIESKVYSINSLLDRFQEWPQLLDPHLASLIQKLADAFLKYCIACPEEYSRQHDHVGEICPLPRAIAQILCAFCKVRGHKVITRLLNNEPKYVQPILVCFHLWTSSGRDGALEASTMIWEEKYIMLLWLSHLMLAPFELSSISDLRVQHSSSRYDVVSHDLPDVAQNLVELGMDHLKVSSKAREAATALIVRLALRRDMQALDLPGRLIEWAVNHLDTESDIDTTGYHSIGILSMLFGQTNSASDSEIAPFVNQLFRLAHDLTISTQPILSTVRDSAPARKLLIKIMRSTAIHAITLSSRGSKQEVAFDVELLLEDCIQALLEYLSDNDTPVRQAASKALSLVALQLDAGMAAEVGEAVLGCLGENMLLENIITGELVVATDMLEDEAASFKKNVNAVNALKWHGAMLTLGHLLFRRALPIVQLPTIIEALLIGLEFEQRSNVGTSVGVGVRDAACFGIWSLARKYSTIELDQVPVSTSMLIGNTRHEPSSVTSMIQVIATHLVVSACLDPSGNLRRGSSAALQELIGRHPDIIIQGIPVVQVVDYHAVARRSRAMVDVAVAAAKLDPIYHHALMHSLLRWRGARATDADSRRQASFATKELASSSSYEDLQIFLDILLTEIRQLKPSNRGHNAAARHGYLLVLASIIETSQPRPIQEAMNIFQLLLPLFSSLSELTGDIDGRLTVEIENVLESISAVIAAASTLTFVLQPSTCASEEIGNVQRWANRALPVLDRCTTAAEKDVVTEPAAIAYLKTFAILSETTRSSLISTWLDPDRQKRSDYRCKGRIATLGLLYGRLGDGQNLAHFDIEIIKYLCAIVEGDAPIETKVNAMQSIGTILRRSRQLKPLESRQISTAVASGLANYTIDQRGDIGSLLRLRSLETAYSLLSEVLVNEAVLPVRQLIVKLATEKNAKIRFQAWSCVKHFWSSTGLPPLQSDFQHQADISSQAYFETLLPLAKVIDLHDSLMMGLISSSAASTDDISRACTEAIVSNMLKQDMDTCTSLKISMLSFLLRYLIRIANQDDREVVPALDFLTFVFEHVIPLSDATPTTMIQSNGIWQTCQQIHGQSATILRLEALVRLYSALLSIEDLRTRVTDRLTRMLLHRWPKIRTLAAEGLYTVLYQTSIVQCDWNAPITNCKPIVLQLRKELGVSGVAAR